MTVVKARLVLGGVMIGAGLYGAALGAWFVACVLLLLLGMLLTVLAWIDLR